MGNKKNKGQAFSTDILVVVVLLLFGVLFLVANQVSEKSNSENRANNVIEKAGIQSEIIVEELKNSEVIDSEDNIDVNNLMLVDVDSIKEDLSIEGDFCIVFEKDNKLVKIDAVNNVTGIGSQKIQVNGVACKSS